MSNPSNVTFTITGGGSSGSSASQKPWYTGNKPWNEYYLRVLGELGIPSHFFGSLVSQAAQQHWSAAEFEQEVFNTHAFHHLFPGIFRPDGTMVMSPSQYRATVDRYRQIASDYGMKVSPHTLGILINGEVSPTEWAQRAQIGSVAAQTQAERQGFNNILSAMKIAPLNNHDWAKFISKEDFGHLENAYEAYSLQQGLGQGVNAKQAIGAAKTIGDTTQFYDPTKLAQLVDTANQQWDYVAPDLQKAGISKADLAVMASNNDPKNQGAQLAQIVANQKSSAGMIGKAEGPVEGTTGGQVGAFAAAHEGD